MSQQTDDVVSLIEALSRPTAYPHPVGDIEVHQTHISIVFLAGPFAYKIKKPVNLGFIDFSSLPQRRHFCEEEVRLNRRLAPHVYLGVVPVTPDADGLQFAGAGAPVEYAVQMKRLPAEATLESRLDRHEVTEAHVRTLAARLADFHRRAEGSARISSFGRFAVVAGNARENFPQTLPDVGVSVSATVHRRVHDLTEQQLQQHRIRIERRAEQNVPRDTHGDLHLDHVYCFPDRSPPDDFVMIDCIEFADRFRFADPVADMAFLAMDFAFHGRHDLGRAFADAYFAARQDEDGRTLLPFYSAYRAVVRAKVEGMELGEKEIDAGERASALVRARAHWLLALGELEQPARRPALVMMAGLPGSGKSTLALTLADRADFKILRSDVIRKELAGAGATSEATFENGIYSAAWTERTYAEMLRRASSLLWDGARVLIDANFRADTQRRLFADTARRWGVPALFIHCVTPPAIARARLEARRPGPSDADWTIYQRLASTWEAPSPEIRRLLFEADTSASVGECVTLLLAQLRQVGIG